MKTESQETAEKSPELVKPQARWLVRITFPLDHVDRADRNRKLASKVVELIWGHEESKKGGGFDVVGETFHELRGPTAEASMRAYAKKLNQDGTPPSKMPKCKADGAFRVPKDDPNQLGFSSLIIRPKGL